LVVIQAQGFETDRVDGFAVYGEQNLPRRGTLQRVRQFPIKLIEAELVFAHLRIAHFDRLVIDTGFDPFEAGAALSSH
jgi:hypothetical protein